MTEQPSFDVRALKDLLSALQDAVQQGQENACTRADETLYVHLSEFLTSSYGFQPCLRGVYLKTAVRRCIIQTVWQSD